MENKPYQPPKQINPEHQSFLTLIGLKLKSLRDEKKINITGLSNELGISRNSYAQMESGKIYFNLLNFLRVLDYHKISASEFFKEL